MSRITLDETEKLFEAGIAEARKFFLIPEEIKIILMNESPADRNANADMRWTASILTGTIRYDMQHLQLFPEKIWPAVGHEVAHLVSRELIGLRDSYAEREKPFGKPFDVEYVEAVEQLTSRLEHLFLRHVPSPYKGGSDG